MRTADGYMVNKCLNGEPEAFGALVDKYRASMYALAYSKLRNFQDAEDVTQEAFMQAYKKLRTLKRYDSFFAWLYSITSNLCKKLILERSKSSDREYIEDQSPGTLKKISLDSYREETVHKSIHEALDSLPEMYQQVLTLHYLGGMSGGEIAEFLGTSHDTIRQRLSRARMQLKKEVIAMMSETLPQQRLQASFTFRIVEMVKKIKIHPVSHTTPLPWGITLATGIIFTILSFNPHLIQFDVLGSYGGSPLPVESKVLKVGEFPVDVLKVSNIAVISNQMGKGKGGELKPDMQNAFFMAPQDEGGTWTKRADMPTARYDFSTSVVNRKIYAIGGTPNEQTWYSIVEEYDPATNIWTKRTDMPTARGCLSTSVMNGRIYVIGGVAAGPSLTSAVEEYNPLIDKWTKKANMPTARFLLSSSAVNGKIYAIGGSDGSVALSTVEEYDPATDTWTKKADMPTKRNGLATIAVNGIIYAIGGQGPGWGPNAGGGFFSTVEAYDPVKDNWTEKAKMPSEKCSFGICTVNGKIYTIAGIGFPIFSEVEEYDPTTDIWTKITDIPTKRCGLSAEAVDGKIYAIGGSTTGPIATSTSIVEEYDTGFVPQKNVEAKGKQPKTWGNIKSAN